MMKKKKLIENGVKSMFAANLAPSLQLDNDTLVPGEFAQDEITNKENLVNKGCLSNDTDFANKDTEIDVPCAVNTSDMNTSLGFIDISKVEPTIQKDMIKPNFKGLLSKLLAHESVSKYKKAVLQSMLTEANFNIEDEKKFLKHMLSNGSSLDEIKGLYGIENCKCINDMDNNIVDIEIKTPHGNIVLNDIQDIIFSADDKAQKEPMYCSLMNYINTKLLNEAAPDWAGPKSYVPDTRINASDVLRAIKTKLGNKATAASVIEDYADNQEYFYHVSQVETKDLPETLDVGQVTLKKTGNNYFIDKMNKDYPLFKA